MPFKDKERARECSRLSAAKNRERDREKYNNKVREWRAKNKDRDAEYNREKRKEKRKEEIEKISNSYIKNDILKKEFGWVDRNRINDELIQAVRTIIKLKRLCKTRKSQ